MTDIALQRPHSYDEIPLKRGLPVVGAGLEMARDPMKFFERMVEEKGRLQRIRLGAQEVVFLHDADDVEQMLLTDRTAYNMSERNQQLTEPLLGNSMPVTTDTLLWEQLHALMLPMFTPKMLVKYFDATRDAIAHEVAELSRLQQQGKSIELYEFVREGVFLALSQTLFSRGIEQREIPYLLKHFTNQSYYVSARYLLGESFLLKLLPSARSGKASLDIINRKIDELIGQRQAENISETDDMLDVLVLARDENGEPLPNKVIRENVMALFFGGQETTPGSITWAFGLLAANPDKRDLMLEEIDRVLGDREPTFQDLSKLTYTQMVLDEAMRLYPMFPYVGREAVRDTELNGYQIKKGTPMGFVGWTVHRDERNWPEPEKFIPERHTPEQKKKRPRCSYLSFGYGQRRCLGERVGRMESMLMLAMVSQKFLLELPDGKLPDYVVRMSPKPRNGMPVQIVSR